MYGSETGQYTVMTVCGSLIAVIGVVISVENVAGQKSLIALVCIYSAAFASAWGPIAWVVTGEVFPLNNRAKAMSLALLRRTGEYLSPIQLVIVALGLEFLNFY